jgi:hypothetical protein
LEVLVEEQERMMKWGQEEEDGTVEWVMIIASFASGGGGSYNIGNNQSILKISVILVF